jgi:outer membrane protein TolC
VNRNPLIRILFVIVVGLAAAGAWAQPAQYSVSTTPGQQARGATLGAPEMRLTLQDAVALALDHNISLEISRLGLAGQRESLLGATGLFDPQLTADYQEAASDTPATNALVGARINEVKRRNLTLGYGQFLPTGGNFNVGFGALRQETNSAFYFLNPSYDSDFYLGLSQPLLRGFGVDVNRTGIEVARRSGEISRLEFERIVIGTLQAVESAYWNLVYQRDNLTVTERSLSLANDLLQQTQTRVRIGTSAPIDIVQSEATVATREQEIIVAQHAVDEAEDLLKRLMGFENAEDWRSRIVPLDSLEIVPTSPDLDESITRAFAKRLELQQSTLQREITQINYTAADNYTLPGLDLLLNYGYTGINALYEANPDGTYTVIQGDFSDSLSMLADRDYAQWSAGVNFSYIFGNHDAKARRAQARYDLRVAEQNLALERQIVIEEVRRTVRGLEASAKAIAAAEKARILAERNLDAEQKKFANGMSTAFQVVKIQDDLASAQASELQARVTYRQAEATYRTAVGTMLDWTGVKIDSEAPPKEPHTGLKDTGWLKYSNYIKGDTAPPPAKQ